MIGAILRAQWLSFLRGGGRGWGVLPTVTFQFLWTIFAIGAAVSFASITRANTLENALASALLAVCAYWQMVPILTASMEASLDLGKLLIYPLDLNRLFVVEVLLRLFTVSEMLIMLTGITAGVAANPSFGGTGTLLRLVSALLLFVLFNLLVAAGVRGWVERESRRKGVREAATFLCVIVCALPRTLLLHHPEWKRALAFLPVQENWPWGAPARLAVGLKGWESAVAMGVLPVWVGLAYWFGRAQFYRTLRTDAAGIGGGPVSSWRTFLQDLFFRLPSRIWRDPLAAMVEKDLRALSRCAGFRLSFLMGFTFGILLFFPQVGSGEQHDSFLREHLLVWTSIYSIFLQGYYTFWNAFGFDRVAVQTYLAAPVPFRSVLRAKNATAGFWQALELLLLTLMFTFLPLALPFSAVAEAVLVTGIVCLYLFALGNLLSVRSPIPLNPEKVSRGQGGRSVTLFGMLLIPVALLPVGLAYWGGYVLESAAVFYGLLGVAAGFGGVLYWVGTDSAVEYAATHREQIVAALSRGQGPLTTN